MSKSVATADRLHMPKTNWFDGRVTDENGTV
jgi:hypothetical protein